MIRTIVGLRPFRPSGFVVRAEKLDAKTVVHNYGHGGAGITLSWGTSQLAVEEGAKSAARRVRGDRMRRGGAFDGAAAADARHERSRSTRKAMPPETTSNVAGGLWEPVILFDGAAGDAGVPPPVRGGVAVGIPALSIDGRRLLRRALAAAVLAVERIVQYVPPPPESPNSEVEASVPRSAHADERASIRSTCRMRIGGGR